MKRLLFFLLAIPLWSFSPSSGDFRNLFHEATFNAENTRNLMRQCQAVNTESKPLHQGYKGAALMLSAQYEASAWTKLNAFNQGKAWLEQAISKDPASLELRYLRFTFQCEAPFFLGYNSDLDKDKAFILAVAPKCSDADLKMRIMKFMLASDELTESEKRKVKATWNT